MRKVIGLGETVFDIIFKNEQPVSATPGGSTYNSMISIGRAGVPAEFISETGDDRVGRKIRDFLEENGVSSKSVCVHKSQNTALSLAFLNEYNDADYTFYKEHNKDRLEFVYPEIRPDDVVIFGSYYSVNPVVRHQVKPFLEYASDHGAILYYDINYRKSHKEDAVRLRSTVQENLQLCDVVRGSHEDFDVLYDLHDFSKIYLEEISPFVRNMIFTRGVDPAELMAGGLHKSYPVPVVDAVSTIGAGDSFNAGFAYGLIRYGVGRDDLRCGLCQEQWDRLFECAQQFSANVCMRMENYIDPAFGLKLKFKPE